MRRLHMNNSGVEIIVAKLHSASKSGLKLRWKRKHVMFLIHISNTRILFTNMKYKMRGEFQHWKLKTFFSPHYCQFVKERVRLYYQWMNSLHKELFKVEITQESLLSQMLFSHGKKDWKNGRALKFKGRFKPNQTPPPIPNREFGNYVKWLMHE